MVHIDSSNAFSYANADDAEKKTCGPGREREHEDVNLVEAFSLAEEYGRRGLVILGDPGSGKTTLLKRLLLYCYHEGPQRLGLPPDAVPVFLPLRDLADVGAGLKTFLKKTALHEKFQAPGRVRGHSGGGEKGAVSARRPRRGFRPVSSLGGFETGLAVLQPVSYWMHREEGRKRATADELAPVIQTALEKQNWEYGSPKEFLEIVRDESGILTGWGDGSFGFMHLGFQEYLAAREIRNRAVVDPNFLEELAERFGQPWFQEVILLFLALRDPSMFVPFMKRVVRQKAFGEPEHSELLEMCLDDAAEPSAEPFLELLKQGPGKDPGKNRSLWKRQLAALRALEQLTPDLKNEDFFASVLKDLENHPFEEISSWAADEKGPEEQDLEHYGPSGYELVRIPGGTFMMGSEESERDRDDDEGPVHEVNVESFHMGRYPVTNAEYERFLKANPEAGEPRYWGERKYNRPEQPVVGVSWTDAKKFADWAGLDLPSEAQWEYACRAGTTTRYYTGDEDMDLNRAGWNGNNSGGRLHPVGEKEPNRFGLYDMHGNVWEWCQDDFHENYDGSPYDGNAWVDSPSNYSSRVVRGGSWRTPPGKCRAASRLHYESAIQNETLGFRLGLNYKFYRHPLVRKYETRPDLLFSKSFAEFIEEEKHLKKTGKWEAVSQALAIAPERLNQYRMLARAWATKDTNVSAQTLAQIIGLDGGEILTESVGKSQYSAYTFSLPRQISWVERDTILVFITAMQNKDSLFDGMEDTMDKQGIYGRYFFMLDLTDEKNAKDIMSQDRPDFKSVELNEKDLKNLALSNAPQSLLTRIIANQAELSDISPYQTEGPIGEAMFFGRKAQLNTIVRRTLGNYMIFGARKSGKTSLLKALERRFKDKFSRVSGRPFSFAPGRLP